ncbi:hypothetical protein PF005_g20190 [Phytophthora fragariae]|uniref:Uncharacterized protein n=1 Tax=Phytophthora fragariae TaxID=53985 RepID=A0A6A3SC51_9STRA|nr:hypothetical protein PF003_g15088 [Phytophthora fragariae]KAE8937038.1 hypothetical protein PF009_g13047 [Phytophthora fragariae]KAE8994057.1 hypothetical protein PF011_g16883 [Phytophthora fragariae]KAE9105535.1 hypothetical protein PF007_g13673 [Phytophthora fragariae]KAE9106229.1 hypothetical protein PF010_g12691 [Phytophthora fragariae]
MWCGKVSTTKILILDLCIRICKCHSSKRDAAFVNNPSTLIGAVADLASACMFSRGGGKG